MPRSLRIGCALLLLAWIVGCSSGPRFCAVSGTVTLDGEPLDEGEILFVDTAGNLGPDPGKIRNGRFECQVKEGKKRVEISASKIIPAGARGAGGEPVPEEIIPPDYNINSKFTEDVTLAGPNKFEFTLKGRKK